MDWERGRLHPLVHFYRFGGGQQRLNHLQVVAETVGVVNTRNASDGERQMCNERGVVQGI